MIIKIKQEALCQWGQKKGIIYVSKDEDRDQYWECPKEIIQGHSLSRRRKCPFYEMFAIKEETDLVTKNTALAREWDIEANGDLKPCMVTASSSKNVGWICEKGHRWEASINNRNNGRKCPYCSGRLAIKGETDLVTTNPELAREWDTEANGELKPFEVTANSAKKVGWMCKKGHKWLATINSRSNGNRCPYCSGKLAIVGETDLLTTNPRLAEEWDYEKNGELKPIDVKENSNKKVWWKCSEGHTWAAIINNRTKGSGCPYCSGRLPIKGENDLLTVNPILAKEWDLEKNGELKPTDVKETSNKKIWWKCPNNHSWVETVKKRKNGRGCPLCEKSMRINTPYNNEKNIKKSRKRRLL